MHLQAHRPCPPWGSEFLNGDKFCPALWAAGEAADGWESVKINWGCDSGAFIVHSFLLLPDSECISNRLHALANTIIDNCAKRWQSYSNIPSQAVWRGHPVTITNLCIITEEESTPSSCPVAIFQQRHNTLRDWTPVFILLHYKALCTASAVHK